MNFCANFFDFRRSRRDNQLIHDFFGYADPVFIDQTLCYLFGAILTFLEQDGLCVIIDGIIFYNFFLIFKCHIGSVIFGYYIRMDDLHARRKILKREMR